MPWGKIASHMKKPFGKVAITSHIKMPLGNFTSLTKMPPGKRAGSLSHFTLTTMFQISLLKERHSLEITWQRRKNLGGRVALPPGKFLRVRKAFARNPWNCTGKFPDPLDNFRIGWIFSGWSGKFPDSLESFRIGWIFSGWSGKFPDSLESFRVGWIFSGWSGKFPDSLESFRIGWIFFRIIQKVSG